MLSHNKLLKALRIELFLLRKRKTVLGDCFMNWILMMITIHEMRETMLSHNKPCLQHIPAQRQGAREEVG